MADSHAKKTVLAISSPGGHWIQLNLICQALQEDFDIIFASPAAAYKSNSTDDSHSINIIDASASSKWRLIPLLMQLLWVLIRYRPDAIVSTGAAPGALAILLARYAVPFLRIHTIWVDSIANVKVLSRSGRMVKKHAHVVLTQWPDLAEEDRLSGDSQRALYYGRVL